MKTQPDAEMRLIVATVGLGARETLIGDMAYGPAARRPSPPAAATPGRGARQLLASTLERRRARRLETRPPRPQPRPFREPSPSGTVRDHRVERLAGVRRADLRARRPRRGALSERAGNVRANRGRRRRRLQVACDGGRCRRAPRRRSSQRSAATSLHRRPAMKSSPAMTASRRPMRGGRRSLSPEPLIAGVPGERPDRHGLADVAGGARNATWAGSTATINGSCSTACGPPRPTGCARWRPRAGISRWCASCTRRGATRSTRPSTCTASSSTAIASWSKPPRRPAQGATPSRRPDRHVSPIEWKNVVLYGEIKIDPAKLTRRRP